MSQSLQTLCAIYSNANYCVSAPDQEITLRVGQVSAAVRTLLATSAAEGAVFITAWNPFGEKKSVPINNAANDKLKAELEKNGCLVLDGYGANQDNSWRENSFFAYPVSRQQAIELCCSYAQNAIVFVGVEGIPEVVFNPQIASFFTGAL